MLTKFRCVFTDKKTGVVEYVAELLAVDASSVRRKARYYFNKERRCGSLLPACNLEVSAV